MSLIASTQYQSLSTSKIEKLHFINSQPGARLLIQACVSGTMNYSRHKAVPYNNCRYPTGRAAAAFKISQNVSWRHDLAVPGGSPLSFHLFSPPKTTQEKCIKHLDKGYIFSYRGRLITVSYSSLLFFYLLKKIIIARKEVKYSARSEDRPFALSC